MYLWETLPRFNSSNSNLVAGTLAMHLMSMVRLVARNQPPPNSGPWSLAACLRSVNHAGRSQSDDSFAFPLIATLALLSAAAVSKCRWTGGTFVTATESGTRESGLSTVNQDYPIGRDQNHKYCRTTFEYGLVRSPQS